MNYKDKFGNRMKEARENAFLSQKELANKLGWTTAQFVSNFERGLSLPPMKSVKTICELLKISEKEVYRLMYDVQKEKLDKKFKGKI